jgi:probable FeS assembly SUF system protein SufT
MSMRKYATLSRDIDVSEIPAGTTGHLTTGTPITILQNLGGSFTAMTMMGYMVRIEGKDADAIGEEPPQKPASTERAEGKSTQDLAWDQLRNCYDPEIPVNIVDLGLVYECLLSPLEDGSGQKASVRFTLTAPGCGMGDFLRQDVIQRLLAVPGIKEVDAEVVFEPQWNQSMMSDAARLQLGMM